MDHTTNLEEFPGSLSFRDIFEGSTCPLNQSALTSKSLQHMKLPELEQSVREGRIVPDKKICLNEFGELAVTKFAVEPVWYLPGVAERFGIGVTFIHIMKT